MSFIERPRSTCALGGALATIGDLPGVVPISHTPSGCAGNLSGATAFGSGNSGSGYCSGGSVPVISVSRRIPQRSKGQHIADEKRCKADSRIPDQLRHQKHDDKRGNHVDNSAYQLIKTMKCRIERNFQPGHQFPARGIIMGCHHDACVLRIAHHNLAMVSPS